jgi:hypothetical protein
MFLMPAYYFKVQLGIQWAYAFLHLLIYPLTSLRAFSGRVCFYSHPNLSIHLAGLFRRGIPNIFPPLGRAPAAPL